MAPIVERREARRAAVVPAVPPRLSALVALARVAAETTESKLRFKTVLEWHSTLPPDIRAFFEPVLPSSESQFGEALNASRQELPDPRLTPEFLSRQLLQEDDPGKAKERGAVFTPMWLARRLTRNALQHWQRLHRTSDAPGTVADVACGTGVFLAALHTELRGASEISGADVHQVSCLYTRALSHALKASWTIQCEDTLLVRPPGRDLFTVVEAAPRYDLLVGNPPYVRSQLLPAGYADKLRELYPSTSDGNFDLSVAFVEHAIESLAEGGVASYVLTHKFMSSSYGKRICARLARDVRVLSIVDFQDHQAFAGYTTYTCVATFARTAPARSFAVTRFPRGLAGSADPGSGQTATLPLERLRSHPWDFATDSAHDALRLLRAERHPPLERVFGPILQGVRTGANQVFVVTDHVAQQLEPEILLPFVNGEVIRRGRVTDGDLKLVFPYERTGNGDVKPRSEADLRSNYPKTWEYLCRHRAILDERSRDPGAPWYAFSRSQNLAIGLLRKLLVREMMPRAELASDFAGRVTFASGYALDASRLSDDELRLWTAVLCTTTMEFALRQTGTQLHSGWFRLLKHHLSRVRLPALSGEARAQAGALANRFHDDPNSAAILESLDNIVADAFGLDQSHRIAMASIVAEAHARSIPGQSNASASGIELDRDAASVSTFEPVRLDQYAPLHRERPDLRAGVTFVPNKEIPLHRWYKYTQGFSAELVAGLLTEMKASRDSLVLDPFAGCGTTNLVCRQLGIPSVGVEISPLMVWVAQTKTHCWKSSSLRRIVSRFSPPASGRSLKHGFDGMLFGDYLAKAYAPSILRQLWAIRQYIQELELDSGPLAFLELGLLSIMEDVSQVRKHGSHYRFMLRAESVGLERLNTQILSPDADIRPILQSRLAEMIADVDKSPFPSPLAPCDIGVGDARSSELPRESVTTVITSPPYLNRNNYIAQQKAELAILSLVTSPAEYRSLVQRTIRSHVEGAFPAGKPVSTIPEVNTILEALSLTENNNPKIPHMICGYFEDLSVVFRELWRVMRGGSVGAFVVGNSRWGGIVVPVDHLLLQIAEGVGFRAERLLVTRVKGNSPQQMREYGRIPVRESIIVFSKP